jgi:hypothetical protein
MVQALPQIQHLGKEPSDLKCANQPKPENPVANGKAASLVRLLKTESLWAGKSFLSIEFTGDTLASWSEAGALNPCDVTQKATGNPQGCGGWALLDANQQSGTVQLHLQDWWGNKRQLNLTRADLSCRQSVQAGTLIISGVGSLLDAKGDISAKDTSVGVLVNTMRAVPAKGIQRTRHHLEKIKITDI